MAEEKDDWGYTYDLLAFKVDTMNEKLKGRPTLPIQYIMDDEDVPKEKRISLLNGMINTLAGELGEAVADGQKSRSM